MWSPCVLVYPVYLVRLIDIYGGERSGVIDAAYTLWGHDRYLRNEPRAQAGRYQEIPGTERGEGWTPLPQSISGARPTLCQGCALI